MGRKSSLTISVLWGARMFFFSTFFGMSIKGVLHKNHYICKTLVVI